MFTDLRYAIRSQLKAPAFSAIAAGTLALGIAATVAIYAVLDSVVLNPLLYDEPDALVRLESPVPGVTPDAAWGVSEAGYFHFRNQNRTFADLGAFTTAQWGLSGAEGAQRVSTGLVSASLLDVLRARPALGRLIEADDDLPNQRTVVVLGYDFWQREYGGDPGVIGRTLQLEATPKVVIGVMAAGIHLPDQTVDVWVPLALDPARRPVNFHWLQVIGRLNKGSTLAAAQRDLDALTAQFTELFPGAYSRSFMTETRFSTSAQSLQRHVIGDFARTLWILLGAVALVLVIACANVANLFLVRAEARRREVAIRGALGAGHMDRVRLGLAEALVLASLAAALGITLADAGVGLLVALGPSGIPRLREIGLDGSTVAFAALIALSTGAVVGSFPLWHAPVDYAALREAAVGLSATPAQLRLRRALVVAQVALALALLAAGGLMLRSFQRLRGVESGFRAANALTVQLRLPASRYWTYQDVLRFYREITARVEALPGVIAAGGGPVPLREFSGCAVVFVEADPLEPGEQPPCVPTPLVSPGYFQALGIPVQGSVPSWAETESGAGGVVVTPALARRLWPGEDAIGKGIRPNGWAQPFYRVLGVTGEVRAQGLDRPLTEAVFFPMIPIEGAPLWAPPRENTLIVRTAAPPSDPLTASIRRALNDLDPLVSVGTVDAMEQVVTRSPAMARTSFTLLLLGIAGIMALVLSVVGLYGVVSYVVSRRSSEIGIRMALGARAQQVAGMVVRESLILTVVGVALGLVGALIGGRVVRALLFEVSPADPATLGTVSLLLLAVAAVASLLPARRAANVDPVVALRNE